MGHLVPLFLVRPILYLVGAAGAGKSTLTRLLAVVCFNAKRISGHSTAALRRAVGAHHGTLIIDEAEELGSAGESPLKKLLRNAFAADEVDIRCEIGPDENWRLASQAVEAGPIVVANISGIRDIALQSRCISIEMSERPEYAKAPVASPADAELQAVSDNVKLWCLQNFQPVRQCYANMENTGNLTGRQFDVYRPLLAVAEALGGPELLAQTWEDIQTIRSASREAAVKFDRDLNLLEVLQGIVSGVRRASETQT
jgi:energy-coupling factor transporter ATP-binding protein EcfA2